MTLRVKVSARAASQIHKAAEWWAENRPAAPGAVRTDIGEALALLAQQPGIGNAYEGVRTKGVRRLLVAMVPLRALPGRPKSENKKLLLSVRYSPEVVAYFRATGEGWQARMDGVLREYVSKHGARRKAT